MAIEVIEWKDDTGKALVWRFAPGGDIQLGAQLVVMENQWAVFFRDGKALDTFGPGRHTLTTANIPLLQKIVNLPFGGKSPFRADVYYVSRKVFTNLKWGTKEPVAFRDSEFDMVRLRAFGVYNLRVQAPQLFVNTLVGTQGYYATDAISDYLRDVIVARLNDVLGENLKTVLDLARSYDELAEALKSRVRLDFEKYGLSLPDLFINAVTPPEELQKKIDERGGMRAVGNMNTYMKYQTAQAVRDAANNPEGGAAGAGVGAGMGIGMGMAAAQGVAGAMMGGQAGQVPTAQGAAGGTAPAGAGLIHCTQCNTGLPAGAKFCFQCGAKVLVQVPAACKKCQAPLPSGAKFCAQCGTAAL